MKRRPEENDDYRQRAYDNPNRVAASVAGLRVADGVADCGRAMRDTVDGAVNRLDVDDFPEDIFGEPHQRASDDGGLF